MRIEQVGGELDLTPRRPGASPSEPRCSLRAKDPRPNLAIPLSRPSDRRRPAGRAERQLARRALFCSANIDLEERRVREVALGDQLLDQPLERQVLVREGVERRPAHPAQQLAEARVSRQRPTRSTRVFTKKPISSSISRRLRPAIGVPTSTSVLAGVAAEQGRPGGQQDHERRRPLAPAQLADRLPTGRRDSVTGTRRAAEGLHRRARPVGGQLQHRAARRRAGAASRRAAPSSTSPCSQLALPDREVGVLHRQRRQRRGQPCENAS